MPAFIETPESRETALYQKYSKAGKFVTPSPQEIDVEDEVNLMLGVLSGPVAVGADLLGTPIDPLSYLGPASGAVRRQLEKGGVTQIPQKMGLVNPATGKAFTGDTFREFIGQDPESGWGMVGEALGGWENILAKGGVGAAKLFATAVEHSPDMVLATVMGARAARQLGGEPAIATMEAAAKRLDNGESPADVLYETSWYRGNDGKMKFLTSDRNVKFIEDKITKRFNDIWARHTEVGEIANPSFVLTDILPSNAPVFRAYPELKDMRITVYLQATEDGFIYRNPNRPATEGGSFLAPSEEGAIGALELSNPKDVEDIRRILLHEIQHQVQHLEGFSSGINPTPFVRSAETVADARFEWDLFQEIDRQGESIMGVDDAWDMMTAHIEKRYPNISEKDMEGALKELAPKIERWMTLDETEWDTTRYMLNERYQRSLDSAAMDLRLGNQSLADVRQEMKNLSAGDIAQLGFRRYWAQGGEAEARLVEYFKDYSLEDFRDLFRRTGAGSFDELLPTANMRVARYRPDLDLKPEQLRQTRSTTGEEMAPLPSQTPSFVEDLTPEELEALQKAVDRDPELLKKLVENL